ncbi:hypothetical protein LUZ60_013671 [Juncus effusus]|nr:hypothetical protein LUZ60_013671 [Juncus effusus]
MSTDSLLSSSPSSTSPPISINNLRLPSSFLPPSSPSPSPSPSPYFPLVPLPEDSELPSSPAYPNSPSFKDLLIYGPHPPPLLDEESGTTIPPSSPRLLSPRTTSDDTYLNIFSCKTKSNLHRSRTAPSISPIKTHEPYHPPPGPRKPSVVRNAMIFLVCYLLFGVVVFAIAPNNFNTSSDSTHPIVDALYFCIVTMCTIGYGDITPATPFAKIFSISFVIIGFGFVDILLSGMVAFLLDLQEHHLLSAVTEPYHPKSHKIARRYIIDVKKGRMRIRLKVALSIGVVVLCVGVGAAVLCFIEKLDWLNAFYLSVMSVTTVGYGDQAFKTMHGRLFASIWLLVSTLAVARAFLYLAEMRMEKRNRRMANYVLSKDLSVSEFIDADIDHNGFVTKSEFLVYKLKQMGKISETDILLVGNQFDMLDSGRCGKITISDLFESHHLDPRTNFSGGRKSTQYSY